MNWWRTKKLCYLFQKTLCTAPCTARQQPSTTLQRSRQRASGQSAAKARSSLPAAFQPTVSQSSFVQVLNRGRPEPGSSSSDSVTSNWSKLHFFQKKMLSEYTERGENLVITQFFFRAVQKNIFIRLKNLPKAYLAGPPAEKPYSAGMFKI